MFNDRGSCLAGAVVTDAVRPGVVQLATGAWYDPLDPADPDAMCVHGNPNVLTFDRGTSRLAQGLRGPARPRRGRAVDRSRAADPRLRAAADGVSPRTLAAVLALKVEDPGRLSARPP